MINNVLIPNIISPINTNKEGINTNKIDKNDKTFSDLLDIKSDELKFSNHANQRLDKRNINLGTNSLERLNTAIDKAISKGSKEALVLLDNAGFIVDAKSKTVVTAFDLNSMKDKVFTNIDTTVLA